ncbi:MAG: peptidyl-tRNA hydrolase [Promethearchaeota archaeon]|jgi:PTH2 family peptidyl-tRNA hydrolase|nr:MAG: peptidyl-tRNA hydrolase [Candidatus Lokiarchaeota archaeon]
MSPRSFNYKMVIIIRADLKMSKGKIAAQAAHAAVTAVTNARRRHSKWLKDWLNEGQKKIVVKVNSLGEMEKLFRIANNQRIPLAKINDAGLTELEPGTTTAIAIGPGPNGKIDKITANLKLL